MSTYIDPLEQFMRFDPDLSRTLPGESAAERLMRAVDELREQVAAAAHESRESQARLYECYREFGDPLHMSEDEFYGHLDAGKGGELGARYYRATGPQE